MTKGARLAFADAIYCAIEHTLAALDYYYLRNGHVHLFLTITKKLIENLLYLPNMIKRAFYCLSSSYGLLSIILNYKNK